MLYDTFIVVLFSIHALCIYVLFLKTSFIFLQYNTYRGELYVLSCIWQNLGSW